MVSAVTAPKQCMSILSVPSLAVTCPCSVTLMRAVPGAVPGAVHVRCRCGARAVPVRCLSWQRNDKMRRERSTG